MTKEEAKAVLEMNNYCLVHGCKKIKGESHPHQQWGTENWVCPSCLREAHVEMTAKIDAAKKVLGL